MTAPGELRADSEPPLCVDLDGTLIRGDALRSGLLRLAGAAPWMLPVALASLARGRPALKQFVASRMPFEPSRCRWCHPVVDFVRREKARGRTLILATAADCAVAEVVASHLQVFDTVLASEPGRNMKGPAKRDAIRKLLKNNEFDYIGDSMADIPIFAAARWSYLVAPSARVLRAARRMGRVRDVFACL